MALAIDSSDPLEEHPPELAPCSPIRQRGGEPSQRSRQIGVPQETILERDPLPFRSDDLLPQHQSWEIDVERMVLVGGIRAVHVTELALKAEVDDAAGFIGQPPTSPSLRRPP
jgi:hypothetical protein